MGTAKNPVFDPADLITHLRPSLRLDAPETFEGSARLDYQIFTGLGGPTSQLSYLGAFADAGLNFAHGGPIGFKIGEHFSRSDRNTNPALGVGSITDANTVDLRLEVRPGGGALEIGAGYAYSIESYELHDAGNVACGEPSCDGSKYGLFDSQTHKGSLDVRWRFYPKTAVALEASWADRNYASDSANIGTRPLHLSAALLGLISEKVRVVLRVGYENAFAQSGQNFKGATGQAEIAWEPSESLRFTAGALRDVVPVSDLYAWVDDARFYASGAVLILGQLRLSGSASADILDFANKDARHDVQAAVSGTAEWEFTQLLRAAVGAVFTSRSSSEPGPFTYQRGELFARVTVAY